MPKETYRLTNITMKGNEHGELAADTIYAELLDSKGRIAISATLDYILVAIRDRGLAVKGVKVEKKKHPRCPVECSYTHLTLYK